MALTNVEFARLAAGLARDAASWSYDICVLPEQAHDLARPEAIACFAAAVRGRIDYLERWAAEPHPALTPEEADRG